MKTSGYMEGSEPAGLYLYLGISKTTFKALLRRSAILFGHVPRDLPFRQYGKGCWKPVGTFSSVSSQIPGNLQYICLMDSSSVNVNKNWRTYRRIKKKKHQNSLF
jgi:hypothetical protein